MKSLNALSLLAACGIASPCIADYSDTIIADDPLGYYRLGEPSGAVATNSATGGSSNGANGTYNGISYGQGAPGLVPTETDTAVAFSNTSLTYINIANASYTGVTDARSAELWFNPTNVSRGGGSPEKQVLWEEGGATRGFNMYVFDGRVYFHAWNVKDSDAEKWGIKDPDDAAGNGDGTARVLSAPISNNQTYHAAFVYDDVGNPTDGSLTGTMTAYLNGVSIGTLTDLGRVYTHSDGAAIGGMNASTLFHDSTRQTSAGSPGNEYFDGTIDDVSIYGYALTLNQVQTHYAQGIPEPSSLALLGLGGLMIARRRRG